MMIENDIHFNIGHTYLGEGKCRFNIWAPHLETLELLLPEKKHQRLPLQKQSNGYWTLETDNIFPGEKYFYLINNSLERPDPIGNLQPDGVHGPSEIVDHTFEWKDQNWQGLKLEAYVIYELHVGTFTPEGTFEAIISRLDDLIDLGITAIELMPVAEFPGDRNWGYDGVSFFAPHHAYGGPKGLKKLVDACHEKNIAVILDVVYNHFGPEGNYLGDFCPYYTEKYNTPWGRSNNFDDAYNEEVRYFFYQNLVYWMENFHIDAFRLDAIHAIIDMSAHSFLRELAEVVQVYSEHAGRKFYVISESDLSDSRILRPKSECGFAHDAQWLDDIHHCIHTLLTGETTGYYADYGKIEHLAKTIKDSYVYAGQYSKHRKRRHGNSAAGLPGKRFVVSTQTHDQVGNRMLGERLTGLVDFNALKLAIGTVAISPYIPMLFMGEEYAEEAPFLYFTSHGDPNLIKGVRQGRKEEFQSFKWKGEPPDPQDEKTFLRSKLNWQARQEGKHKLMWQFYQALLKLRKSNPALANLSKHNLEIKALEEERLLFVTRWESETRILCLLNYNSHDVTTLVETGHGIGQKLLDSYDTHWMAESENQNITKLSAEVHPNQEVQLKPYQIAIYQLKSHL